ncbi:MAG: flippase-like domain-containing protein [Chitinophagaceae bacterium]|nr:flippase-like domain-containing protein [Chitinophagaceae bacterium]
MRLNKNIKLILKYFIAPVLAGWLFYSLYQQVKNQPNLSESLQLIKDAPLGPQGFKFWAAIILVFFNWGTEAIKWQYLATPIEKISFWKALKSVLSGVTLSLNIPNRMGEYGGRILYLKEGKRLKAISLSIAGSISQLIVTLFMGCIGLSYLLMFALEPGSSIMGLSYFWVEVMFLISCIVTCVVILFFFRMAWLIRLVEKIPQAHRLVPYIEVLGEFDTKVLLRLIVISFFRYVIFVLQYILLWQALNITVSWTAGIWLISVLFLVMAAVPSFAIADLGIRGQFSVALLGLYCENTIGIIAATFGIWILNLFLPAVAGSLAILSVKLFKDSKE